MTTLLARSLALLALAPGLAGCALFPKAAAWVDFKSVQTSEVQRFTREDGYYNSATRAIARRDYAGALEMLQGARAYNPDDVRVLNAFAVVYDKLGRFDLSARYYEQAERLDPGSQILAGNMAYSASLQTRLAAPAYAALQPAPAAAPVRSEPALAARPAVVRLGPVQPILVARTGPGQMGRPLELADLSGRAGGAEPVRSALRRLGWSVGEAVVGGERQARTTITYGDRNAMVAQALQRTLPGPASLIRCNDDCQGIRLAIGADAVGWAWPNRADQVLRGD
ncbi:LytR C-terminal domain-containing protein [Phenylobacterium sp.]|uniref:LytR C-terminal domain-containing protein n=1 Tax=Phenylobacterium sp. TaxID=1871053 RepID=UPI00289C50F3|nr:LytR C-terminal domain-containing protein [Phenylobacterium sp.]